MKIAPVEFNYALLADMVAKAGSALGPHIGGIVKNIIEDGKLCEYTKTSGKKSTLKEAAKQWKKPAIVDYIGNASKLATKA